MSLKTKHIGRSGTFTSTDLEVLLDKGRAQLVIVTDNKMSTIDNAIMGVHSAGAG